MSNPTSGNGKICYLEIPCSDEEKSSQFYKNIFGWTIRADNAGNVAFDDGVGQVSGMWVKDRLPANHIGIIISVMVTNIRETIELIRKNGGAIMKEDIEGAEKIAWFEDPYGNVLGLYQHVDD